LGKGGRGRSVASSRGKKTGFQEESPTKKDFENREKEHFCQKGKVGSWKEAKSPL